MSENSPEELLDVLAVAIVAAACRVSLVEELHRVQTFLEVLHE